MPVGPTVADSYAPALAAESRAIEAEIEALARSRQLKDAANDQTAPIPQRYRDAVDAARGRLARAEGALALAETNVRVRIRQQQPSEALARVWFEEAVLVPGREVQAAKQALADAELALGRRIEKKRRREQVESEAPNRRTAAAERYQAELDQIDRDLMLARIADAD